MIINSYINLEVSIIGEPDRQILLPFDYSREDFLENLKSRISTDIYQLIGHNFLCYSCNPKGILVELPDVTNLQTGTSIFLYNDSFCSKEFLELLAKVGYKSLSAIFAYAGVVDTEVLIATINDNSFHNEMKKLVGRNPNYIFMKLEKVLKGK